MKLFTNGCSFTWGAEILENVFNVPYNSPNYIGSSIEEHDRYRKENIWAHHLCKKLNAEDLVNLSVCGGSNQRIVRTTLEFFIDMINKKESIDDYICIIQWSDPSRCEIYDEETKNYLQIHSGNISSSTDRSKNKILKYRFLAHPKTYDDEWYVHLVCLANFFERHKIRYLFCTMNKRIIPGAYFNNMMWLGDSPQDNQILNTFNFRYRDKHPDLQGHKIISKRLYDRIKILYNI